MTVQAFEQNRRVALGVGNQVLGQRGWNLSRYVLAAQHVEDGEAAKMSRGTPCAQKRGEQMLQYIHCGFLSKVALQPELHCKKLRGSRLHCDKCTALRRCYSTTQRACANNPYLSHVDNDELLTACAPSVNARRNYQLASDAVAGATVCANGLALLMIDIITAAK